MSTLVLDYVEAVTQRRLSLSEGEIVPLGLDDLLALRGKLNEPIAFPLRIRGAFWEWNRMRAERFLIWAAGRTWSRRLRSECQTPNIGHS